MTPTHESVAEAFIAEAGEELTKAAKVIRHCLGQLTDEQMAWRPQESMNSVGNLILHLCGNVRQRIVSAVGGAPDVRNRPKEFAERGPFKRDDLLHRMAEVIEQADEVLKGVMPNRLLEHCRVQGVETNCLSAIFRSAAHFKGHTQEIVCLTRMQLGDNYKFDWIPKTAEEGAPEA